MMFKNILRQKKLTQELCENRNRFYKLAYAWTRDRMLADDLVQEAMQKAIQSFDSLREDDKLIAWTCRIMLNCHRDWLRRNKDHADVDDFDFADNSDPQQDYSRQDTSRLVRQHIAQLQPKHREVITLVDLMEFSYQEVSLALDIPIGTVMSRLCRARNQLRDSLKIHMEQNSTNQQQHLRRVK